MTESKFTPGPWIFGAKGDWTISSAAHSGSLMGNASYYPWVPENKADWHLIAAAPELYEALEECAIDLKEWILNRYPEESLKYPSIKKDFELDISIVDKAFAALAKARGESHE